MNPPDESDTVFVSTIIATKRETSSLVRTLSSLENQEYPRNRYEVIVSSVNPCHIEGGARFRNVVACRANQAEARDIAEEHAGGEILAFCDDDCVLPTNWLRNGVKHFAEPQVAAVGGPTVPPFEGVTLMEALAGALHISYLGAGSHSLAFYPHGRKEAFFCRPTNIVAANLFVDRKKFREAGGFGKSVPQEEDRFNNKLLRLGYRLVYDPKNSCVHYQRSFGLSFLRNMFWLAVGSGRFAREDFQALNKLYLVPPLFAIGVVMFPALVMLPATHLGCLVAGALYFAVTIGESVRIARKVMRSLRAKLLASISLPFCFFLHHLTFGLGFIVGMLRGRPSPGESSECNL